MPFISVLVRLSAHLRASELEIAIREREMQIGRLIAISRGLDEQTWLTMADGDKLPIPAGRDKPANEIVLVRYDGGQVPAKPGHSLVCIGICSLQEAGEPTPSVARVAIFRPN